MPAAVIWKEDGSVAAWPRLFRPESPICRCPFDAHCALSRERHHAKLGCGSQMRKLTRLLAPDPAPKAKATETSSVTLLLTISSNLPSCWETGCKFRSGQVLSQIEGSTGQLATSGGAGLRASSEVTARSAAIATRVMLAAAWGILSNHVFHA